MTETGGLTEASWRKAALEWTARYVPTERCTALIEAWREHDAHPTPVVTLLGAYDSAKSSLLRRLLVDAGQRCPDWLTISARHETFDVSTVTVSGVIVRDTPGLAPAATDPRGKNNNERAMAAARLTDVLVLVTPPQLTTGETDLLRTVVDQVWPPASLRCVISRFDEAGIDATGDPDGYAALAARKAQELRNALHLTGETPVDIVAPDAWQLAGDDRQPEPSTWDVSRNWDGITEFRAALAPLAAPNEALRAAAARRYWTFAVQVQADEIRRHREQIRASLQTADQNRRRHANVLDRLDQLERVARMRLDEALTRLLDLALNTATDDKERLHQEALDTLTTWLEQQHADLDRLLRDFDTEFGRQLERPAWIDLQRQLDQLLAVVGAGRRSTGSKPATPESTTMVKNRLLELNASLSKSLTNVRAVFAKRTKDFSATSRTPRPATAGATTPAGGTAKANRLFEAGEVVVALGPTVADVVSFITDLRREREQRDAERQALERLEQKMSAFRAEAGERAFETFAATVDGARQFVRSTAEPLEGLVASLTETDKVMAEALDEAATLLQPRGSEPRA